MLSCTCNTFLERIQSLHDGIFIVEKVLCVLVQRMLEMSRCLYTGGNYTLAEILSKILGIDRKSVTLSTIMTCQFSDLMLTSLLADILYGHCPHDRRLCIRKMLVSREMKYFQKCDFLLFFFTFLLEFGSPIEYTFRKMYEKQFVAKIYCLVYNCSQENYHRCHYPQLSKSGWGNSTPNISSRIKYFLLVSH